MWHSSRGSVQEVLCITGGRKLEGDVRVSGAKNSALPLIFATLLSPEPCVLRNVPDLEDISVTMRLLRSLGTKAKYEDHCIHLHTPEITGTEAPYASVKALRASFWVLGPLLARAGQAQVSLPGGDAIGTRPVDLHIKGLQQLGAEIHMKHGVVHGTAPGGLQAGPVHLDFPSVGATHNLLMTAALIPGETILSGAAREPEVVELANLLSAMGAEIEGAGSDIIIIRGRERLKGVDFSVLGDRIEAVTYLLSGAVTAGRVRISGIAPQALHSSLELLKEMGCELQEGEDWVELQGPERLRAVSFCTAPYPGVATDVQALFMAALTRAEGTSVIEERVFESRMGHAAEYRRFGADISISARIARVSGKSILSAAPVESNDIRAAAGLVLMGLVAEGVTQVRELYHLDRGYDGIVGKLEALGADISRIPAFDNREVVWGC